MHQLDTTFVRCARRSIATGLAAVAVAATASIAPASAATFNVVHSFTSTDGAGPQGSLFYSYIKKRVILAGTTLTGGSASDGVVYQYDLQSNVLSDLYSFLGNTDGATPSGGVATDLNYHDSTFGDLFGVTQSGGTNGLGTIWRIDTNGAYASVYSFGSVANPNGQPLDGTQPEGTLAQALDGNFYGTTANGGSAAVGTIFQFQPATSTFKTLYTFGANPNVADGAQPLDGPTLNYDKNLYGATSAGGGSGLGSIYKLTTAGVVSTIYSFTGATDGSAPSCILAADSNDNLYGVTSNGGKQGAGAVWKISSTGAFTLLYSFPVNASGVATNGSAPTAGLAFGPHNVLYGTTTSGGKYNGGTVFSINSSGGAFTKLHDFNPATEGDSPATRLVYQPQAKLFYGTTQFDGANGSGALFSIAP